MPLILTPSDTQNKSKLLNYFRERGNEKLGELKSEIGSNNYKELASGLNKVITESLANFREAIIAAAKKESWKNEDVLRSILASTYCAQVAMLDLRNDVWPYEYMAFSRRIGELWEHFVHIPFAYSVTDATPFIPPLFEDVKKNLRNEIEDYIQELPLSAEQRSELINYYEKVWLLVDSGEISLQLDLHTEIGGKKLNIDFKSGFGSNEKGNTNRLLMVATIYANLGADYENVLLVRAREDLNNHYFKTLKRSAVWQAYCGDEAYEKIGVYTGFALKTWIKENLDWQADLQPQTFKHFSSNNLTQYLEW